MAIGAPALLTAVSLVATGFQVIQQRNAAKDARAQAKAQAKQEEVRLRDELIKRNQQFLDQTNDNIAAAGASGTDPFQGTNLEITNEGFKRFNLETLTAEVSSSNRQNEIKRSGNARAKGFEAQAVGSLINTGVQFANRG